jgi:uncharacterized protein YdhG (YjbR/CyaY superfamily)
MDAYIATFPSDVQAILEQIRTTIHETVPGAQETISYQMPTFSLNGQYLVYFAAYKKHISLYPAPTGVEEFQEALAVYGAGKGTLKFPLNQPIPFDLIRRFVAFRAKEALKQAEAKSERP